MREIKFRAWDKEFEEMSPNEEMFIEWFDGDDPDLIVMQYTGLKDKNGKEIYEGDILRKYYSRDTSGKDVVIFNEPVEFETNHEGSGFKVTFLDRCEVIGNIYENPELLK